MEANRSEDHERAKKLRESLELRGIGLELTKLQYPSIVELNKLMNAIGYAVVRK